MYVITLNSGNRKKAPGVGGVMIEVWGFNTGLEIYSVSLTIFTFLKRDGSFSSGI